MKNTYPKLSKLLIVVVLLSLYKLSYAHLASLSTAQNDFTKHFKDTIKTKKAQLAKDINVEDTIFSFVEEMPEFPGGADAMMKFLSLNLKVENIDSCFSSRVVIEFVVSKGGRIVNPKIIRSACPTIDQQVMKVIKSFPDWKPGKHNGKSVNVSFTIPVILEFRE